MKRFLNLTCTLACVLGLASAASAQELITWDASVQMYPGTTDQTFVNTDGVSAYAANMDARTDQPASITLNGVTFATTNLAGLSSLVGPTGVTMSTTIPSETGASYQDGSFGFDADIFNVIATGIFGVDPVAGVGDVTFSGLTPGQTYEIQIFVNDARGGRSTNFVAAISDGVDNGAALTPANAVFCDHSNRDPLDPTMGEASGDSITGTFVAGAGGTQTFSMHGSVDGGVSFNSAGRCQINAIQLRDVTSAVACVLGDVDTSGVVDFADIGPFVALLSGGGFQCEADTDESGTVDFADIGPFVAILSGP